MGANIPDYEIGSQGVNIVATPLHTPDGGLLVAKNVEFIREFGIGGLGTRRGIAKLPGSSVLAGDVNALVNAPFPLYSEVDLMVGLNAGETPSWKKSVDGTTYTNLTTGVIERTAGITKSPTNASSIFLGQRAASFRNQFYFAGDNYVVDTSAPPLVNWNGTLSFEQFSIPNNPTSGAVCKWISDLFVFNGFIYIAVYDPGGSAPNHKGRVMQYDPSNGELTLVGNAFGQGTGENAGGFPFCLTSYLGYLWAGTYGISGNNQGKVYRIQPGVDSTWTLDLTATLHNGYYMSLCQYRSELFAATDADSSGTSIIQKRTSVGVWSTSFTAPNNNVSYCGGMIVFNDLLFAAYYGPGVKSYIKVYNGSAWTTDKDVGVDYAIKAPGAPFIYGGALYWPFLGSDSSGTNTTGFVLKRTTAGTWTKVLDQFGIRGGLGQFIPEPT